MLYIFLHLIFIIFFRLVLGAWCLADAFQDALWRHFSFLFFCSTSLDHFRPAEV